MALLLLLLLAVVVLQMWDPGLRGARDPVCGRERGLRQQRRHLLGQSVRPSSLPPSLPLLHGDAVANCCWHGGGAAGGRGGVHAAVRVRAVLRRDGQAADRRQQAGRVRVPRPRVDAHLPRGQGPGRWGRNQSVSQSPRPRSLARSLSREVACMPAHLVSALHRCSLPCRCRRCCYEIPSGASRRPRRSSTRGWPASTPPRAARPGQHKPSAHKQVGRPADATSPTPSMGLAAAGGGSHEWHRHRGLCACMAAADGVLPGLMSSSPKERASDKTARLSSTLRSQYASPPCCVM